MMSRDVGKAILRHGREGEEPRELYIGVLGFQGDLEEHVSAFELAFEHLGIRGRVGLVKTDEDIRRVDGLVIPGGESTVMGLLASFSRTLSLIKERVEKGLPVLGTCAGMIFLARRVYDRVVGETKQPVIGIMDILVERNSFGRQRESFEADLSIPVLGDERLKGVFIRAPTVKEAGPGVKVLAKLDEEIVAVQQGNQIGTSFHPELGDDTRLHEYFLNIVIRRTEAV